MMVFKLTVYQYRVTDPGFWLRHHKRWDQRRFYIYLDWYLGRSDFYFSKQVLMPHRKAQLPLEPAIYLFSNFDLE